MRVVIRLGTVLALFLGLTFVNASVSQALEVPRTLADRQPVGAAAVTPAFPIDYLAVLYDVPAGLADDHEHGEERHGQVRFRVDGAWTAWQSLIEDGANAPGQWASALVPAGDAEAYQVRGLPDHADGARAVAINTTDGPREQVGRRPAGGAQALPKCLSRVEWGADEKLRFDAKGAEVWPAEIYPAQTMTVHHTATRNADPDPAATVRAIYRFHAVDRGWGDIGYNYLVDEKGRVYEGRWSGSTSAPCAGGAGGTDFAHDDADGLVTGAHAAGYNSGNMGAALLGTFTTDPSSGGEPAPEAVSALETLLAEFASRHGLDPRGTVTYVNPVTGASKSVRTLSAHRDWTSTECPGERLYDKLPTIREAVATKMAGPTVSLTAPVAGATVSGAVGVTATASSGVTSVAFTVGGVSVGTDGDPVGGWSATWDTTTFAEGAHTLTATATDGQRSTSTSVSVVVDNDTPPVVVLGSPADGSTVSGSSTLTASVTDDRGVSRVDFRAGGVLVGSDTSDLGGWSAVWDTTGVADGSHLLTATATDSAGQQASHAVTVSVDNQPDPVRLTVTGVSPDRAPVKSTVTVTVTGTGFAPGAVVDLQNGDGPDPAVSVTSVSGSTSITATITIRAGGPAKNRTWDVVVTNRDGTSAVLRDGFTVVA